MNNSSTQLISRLGQATKSIAISGLHRGENPQPGPSVIASIRRSFPSIRIIGLSYDSLESSLYSDLGDQPDVAYSMPYPDIGPEALTERIEYILERENLIAIIPCLDLEIPNFISISPKLHEWGIKCILPTIQSLEVMNKSNLYNFCRQIDVFSPKTKSAVNPSQLEFIAEELGYPVYVKGRIYEAQLANSKQELIESSKSISKLWGWPLLVQEALIGEEYNIAGLADGKGDIIASCSIRKFQRSSNGKGFAGVVIEDPELDRLAKRIIKQLHWNGPFELEFIKMSGKPHALFEINPRFPAWVDFPSQVGCNLPARLIENLINKEHQPLQPCSAGQMFIRHSIDLVTNIADIAEMTVTGEHISAPITVQIETTQ
jgi:carbamoyl-phosphate synthase large subunit